MRIQIRRATRDDAAAVAALAGELAQSFAFSQAKFEVSYPSLVDTDDACLLVAEDDGEPIGYLLGFRHLTSMRTAQWDGLRKSESAPGIAVTAPAVP